MTYDPIQQMKLNEMKEVVALHELQEQARDWLDEKMRERYGKQGQVLPLEFYPSRLLKQVCEPIPLDSIRSRDTVALSESMIFTMYMCGGIGLAAPQVGLNKRIFVLDWSQDRKHPVTCINPELISVGSDDHLDADEACLSMPGVKIRVNRSTSAKVAFYSLEGKRLEMELIGWAARAYQHEMDHLEGKMMFDHPSVHRIARQQAIKKASAILRGERPVKKGKRRR